MPSPFQQKYSSQTHKIFGDYTMSSMPEAPDQDADRRGSNTSTSSTGNESPTQKPRRDSFAQQFSALNALKRPMDPESTARRASLQDSYGKPGFFGSMWNSFTRGPSAPAKMPEQTQSRETATVKQ